MRFFIDFTCARSTDDDFFKLYMCVEVEQCNSYGTLYVNAVLCIFSVFSHPNAPLGLSVSLRLAVLRWMFSFHLITCCEQRPDQSL